MLQFITHHNDRYDYLTGTQAVLDGGCRWVQLRMKGASDEEVLRTGREVAARCRACGATFILDDRVELAGRLHADGVHLGKADMPVREARRLLGPGFRIGGTANTFEDVRIHYEGGADYIGCGPFRYTTTKQKLAPILGLEGYRAITARMREEGIDLPVVGIGGVTAEDMSALAGAGNRSMILGVPPLRHALLHDRRGCDIL